MSNIQEYDDYSDYQYYDPYAAYGITLDSNYTCDLESENPYNIVPYNIIGYEEYGTWLFTNSMAYFQFHRNRASNVSNFENNFCKNNLFADKKVTEFHRLAFDYYCRAGEFEKICDDEFETEKTGYSHCNSIIKSGNLLNQTLSNPAAENEIFNQLMSIRANDIPFCGLQYFGFTRNYYDNYLGLSLYNFLPNSCKISLVFAEIFIFLLMLLILIGNFLILTVMIRYRKGSVSNRKKTLSRRQKSGIAQRLEIANFSERAKGIQIA